MGLSPALTHGATHAKKFLLQKTKFDFKSLTVH